jgi:hypothetical protein
VNNPLVFAPRSPLEAGFWNTSSAAEARMRLVEALHYELLGPSEAEEELFESPVTRYLTGLLAPFGTGVLPTEQDVALAAGNGDEDAGGSETTPPISQAMTPSSIGISFLVSEDVEEVVATAEWGEYDRLKADDDIPEEPEPAGFEEDEAPPSTDPEGDGAHPRKRARWKRRPVNPEPVPIRLAPEGGLKRIPLDASNEITLEHLTRRISGHYAVSLEAVPCFAT